MGKWRDLLEADLPPVEQREYRTEYVYGPPATPEAIAAAEAALGVRLPADVRELLAEFNGAWRHNRYPAGNTSEDIHLLDLQHMSVDVPDYFSDSGNPLPPADELRRVVWVAQDNGFGDLWGVCAEPVAGHPAGAVVKLDHEVGELEASHPNLAAFVRVCSK